MRDALVTRLTGYERVVEVGIGREPAVATKLAEHSVEVVAVDVHDFPVPEGVQFVHDDVFARADSTEPGPYEGVDVIYALNVPVELHRPTARVARRVGADFLFTTLGYDEPSIPVSRESLPGDTLFVADDSAWGQGRSFGRSQE